MGYSSDQHIYFQEELYYRGMQYAEHDFPVYPREKRHKENMFLKKVEKFIKWLFSDGTQPLPDPAGTLYEQQIIEESACFIQRQIRSCDNPRYLESLARMVANLPVIYGNKTQVNCWVDSLNLQIYNKKKQLSTN